MTIDTYCENCGASTTHPENFNSVCPKCGGYVDAPEMQEWDDYQEDLRQELDLLPEGEWDLPGYDPGEYDRSEAEYYDDLHNYLDAMQEYPEDYNF